MTALGKLTAVESKLYLRDPASWLTVVAVPIGLLLVLSLIPGATAPSDDFGGHQPLAAFIAPLCVTLVLAMVALTIFPAYLGTYREKGILLRLAASPVPPRRLLIAQLVVHLVAAVVVVVLIVAVGHLALGMELPANPGGFAVAALLGALALFSVGLVVAAVAPSGRAASGIGSAALFPMLALGGVWVPKEHLPAVLRDVADVLPLGAALNALRESWVGATPRAVQLVALAVAAAVCLVVAVRFFRWGPR
ncbi:ABC-2 type transport system permease protein [Amycolatopsis arida]|uniref:Transport permease protein n=1 Tax=Amycolatopsis arida TaxID=587909 RepID=A0A1I6AFL9_9PSEU|nr:ABC transporter permease [Amycolatopsis arida]TDX97697.1 ABC-2 type transport system permease protein [Amycolatopsis arida]SFQ67451.1 ABC-2 type transport system permease protein [Amycolatopsis arida]